MKTKKEIEKRQREIHREQSRLDKEYDKLHTESRKLDSDLYALDTGKAFGDIFSYDGKDYKIINTNHAKKVDGVNTKWAPSLREYLKGKSPNPFKRLPE